MADDAINAGGHQGVPGLDGDQSTEAIAEHKNRHGRRTQPTAKITTPTQRRVSPSIVQKPILPV